MPEHPPLTAVCRLTVGQHRSDLIVCHPSRDGNFLSIAHSSCETWRVYDDRREGLLITTCTIFALAHLSQGLFEAIFRQAAFNQCASEERKGSAKEELVDGTVTGGQDIAGARREHGELVVGKRPFRGDGDQARHFGHLSENGIPKRSGGRRGGCKGPLKTVDA